MGVNGRAPSGGSGPAAPDTSAPNTPGPEDAVLAIDAGNSKTDIAVVRMDGTLLATARGAGFQPQAAGAEHVVRELSHAVDRAWGRALERAKGRAPDTGTGTGTDTDPMTATGPEADAGSETDTGPLRLAHVAACLANVDLPPEEREMERLLLARRWGGTLHLANDTFAVLRAGLSDDAEERHRSAVAVVCGAGINCAGRTADGRTHRFAAVGELSGDWGGGAGLARAALWHAARAEDGRGEPTALARVLPGHFGLPSMDALIEALHLGHLAAERRHEIAPLLFAAAEDGDAVALRLVRRQAEEIASMVEVTLDRLGLRREETPVILGGGVVRPRNPLLYGPLEHRFPVLRTVTAPPVLGAALLGLDHAGAPEGAHGRVRAEM